MTDLVVELSTYLPFGFPGFLGFFDKFFWLILNYPNLTFDPSRETYRDKFVYYTILGKREHESFVQKKKKNLNALNPLKKDIHLVLASLFCYNQ